MRNHLSPHFSEECGETRELAYRILSQPPPQMEQFSQEENSSFLAEILEMLSQPGNHQVNIIIIVNDIIKGGRADRMASVLLNCFLHEKFNYS